MLLTRRKLVRGETKWMVSHEIKWVRCQDGSLSFTAALLRRPNAGSGGESAGRALTPPPPPHKLKLLSLGIMMA